MISNRSSTKLSLFALLAFVAVVMGDPAVQDACYLDEKNDLTKLRNLLQRDNPFEALSFQSHVNDKIFFQAIFINDAVETLDVLLQQNKDFLQKNILINNVEYTPLTYAVHKHSLKIISYLIKKTNPDFETFWSLLKFTLSKDSESLLLYVVTNTPSELRTQVFISLMQALTEFKYAKKFPLSKEKNYLHSLEWLLKNGVDANHQEANTSLLLYASTLKISDVVALLIKHGANKYFTSIPDSNGRFDCPFVAAYTANDFATIKVFLKAHFNLQHRKSIFIRDGFDDFSLLYTLHKHTRSGLQAGDKQSIIFYQQLLNDTLTKNIFIEMERKYPGIIYQVENPKNLSRYFTKDNLMLVTMGAAATALLVWFGESISEKFQRDANRKKALDKLKKLNQKLIAETSEEKSKDEILNVNRIIKEVKHEKPIKNTRKTKRSSRTHIFTELDIVSSLPCIENPKPEYKSVAGEKRQARSSIIVRRNACANRHETNNNLINDLLGDSHRINLKTEEQIIKWENVKKQVESILSDERLAHVSNAKFNLKKQVVFLQKCIDRIILKLQSQEVVNSKMHSYNMLIQRIEKLLAKSDAITIQNIQLPVTGEINNVNQVEVPLQVSQEQAEDLLDIEDIFKNLKMDDVEFDSSEREEKFVTGFPSDFGSWNSVLFPNPNLNCASTEKPDDDLSEKLLVQLSDLSVNAKEFNPGISKP